MSALFVFLSELLHTFRTEMADPVFQLLSRRKATVFFLTVIVTGCVLACCQFSMRMAMLLAGGIFSAAVLTVSIEESLRFCKQSSTNPFI